MFYLFLLEEYGCYDYLFVFVGRGCYGCISNIGDAFINKHAQSTVYSVTKKHHACSLLECTTTVYISTRTYKFSDRYGHVDA